MERTLKLNTNIQVTVSQIVDLARQLPKKERLQLASLLIEEEDFISKDELLFKIKEGLEDVKLHKEGTVKLRTLDDFLADV
ncbi:MAG: hypothetical protein Q8K92_24350 [Leadbetterella sp.]|nr:hypothetical protein [Leadbetterella sp.]